MNYVTDQYFGLDEIEFSDCTRWAVAINHKAADEAAKEYICDSAWAFRSEFLANLTGLSATVFEALSSLCESSNEAVLGIIERCSSLNEFVKAAIEADGRGHLLSQYDGNELEFSDLDEECQREFAEWLYSSPTIEARKYMDSYALQIVSPVKNEAIQSLITALKYKPIFFYRQD